MPPPPVAPPAGLPMSAPQGPQIPSPLPGPPEAVREGLHAIYRALEADVAAAGPVCELSGRCCRFREFDHTLFLTAPEADLLLAEAPTPPRPLDDGDTCPWQDDRGHCTARDARPLGCRVYFCDPSYQERAHELTEAYLGRLRVLVQAHDLAWNYAPLHRHLHAARADGRFPAPPAAGSSAAPGAGAPDPRPDLLA